MPAPAAAQLDAAFTEAFAALAAMKSPMTVELAVVGPWLGRADAAVRACREAYAAIEGTDPALLGAAGITPAMLATSRELLGAYATLVDEAWRWARTQAADRAGVRA